MSGTDQVRVQVEGGGQVTGIVLLSRPAVHHKEPHAVLREAPGIRRGQERSGDVRRGQVRSGGIYLLVLVGLQDLGDGDGEAEGLTQVQVLLLQGHQAAAKQVLVLLVGPRAQNHRPENHIKPNTRERVTFQQENVCNVRRFMDPMGVLSWCTLRRDSGVLQ